jgi:hypothetical protein
VFERFTDEARRVLVVAQEESRQLVSGSIDPRHVLFGLASEGSASPLLTAHGLTPHRIHEVLRTSATEGNSSSTPPLTSSVKKVFEGALREMLAAGRADIGCIQLLVSLLRIDDGPTTALCQELGVARDDMLALAVDVQSSQPKDSEQASPRVVVGTRARRPPSMTPGPSDECITCGRDLWEVDHYVTNGTVILCEVCIRDGAALVDAAPPEIRSLVLPPRVYGDPPDREAVNEIVTSVSRVLDPTFSGDHSPYLEDAETLLPYLQQAGQRFTGQKLIPHIRRVRFSEPKRAWIEVSLLVGLEVTWNGLVIEDSGRWKVSRDLLTDIVRRAGVHIPPPPSAAAEP